MIISLPSSSPCTTIVSIDSSLLLGEKHSTLHFLIQGRNTSVISQEKPATFHHYHVPVRECRGITFCKSCWKDCYVQGSQSPQPPQGPAMSCAVRQGIALQVWSILNIYIPAFVSNEKKKLFLLALTFPKLSTGEMNIFIRRSITVKFLPPAAAIV